MVWSITSVDTMKDSRDTCYPLTSQMSAAAIAQGVNLCAGLNVTHITCDVYYDYPDYMATWVAAIRATGKNVWFRPHWNAWEGNNGVSATMTPAQYLSSTIAFIQAHPDLFQPGDILDACPEADNAPYWVNTYGANYTSGAPNAATDAFNQFLIDCHTQIQDTLQTASVVGVETRIRSLNSFWAQNPNAFYPTTVDALGGFVTIDSYPEGSSTDPTTCANARRAELQKTTSLRRGVRIILGEMGYSNNVNVDDATQQSVLAAEFAMLAQQSAIVGMNYWVAQGAVGRGGYTFLFNGDRGSYGYRPAALTLRDFYFQQLYGGEAATVNVNGTDIAVMTTGAHLFIEAGSLNVDQAVGQRSTADFTIIDEAGTHHYEQGMPVTISDDVTGQRIFGGIITDAQEDNPNPTRNLLVHSIACADWHYLADKRRIAYSNANVTAGQIVQDIVTQVLGAEGVTYQRGVNLYSANQSDVETDTNGFLDELGSGVSTGVTITRDTTAGNAWHGAASLKVVANGSATFQYVEVQIPADQYVVGQQYVCSFYVKSDALSSGKVLRYMVNANGGAVSTSANLTLSTTWTRYSCPVFTNPGGKVWMGLRLDTGGTAQSVTFFLDGIQMEAGSVATAWELGGLQQTVQSGPTINEFTSNYETCAACFDALAQAATYYWQIDANKVLWFVAPGTVAAPWDATGADMFRGATMERTNPLYRNRQYVLGGTDQTSTQVEVKSGDGNNTTFTVGYPVAKAPTVETNIGGAGYVTKTVGIGQVDSGKDWYWNAGSNQIVQDSGGTKLTSADLIRITYVGEFPVVVLSSDDAEVSAQLAREGGAGTGYVDDVVVDSTLKTRGGAFQLAAGYIAKYARLGRKLTFTTLRGGLAQGQLLNVTLPAFALDSDLLLLESVHATHDGLQFRYEVSALEGPINSTWVQFFQALAAQTKATVDSINLGSGNTVTLLQSFTATKATSATFTATVYACPLFPATFPLTLC